MSAQLETGVVHELSRKSTKLGRNAFIFQARGRYVRVIAGFNQEATRAETTTICRWLRLLMPNVYTRSPDKYGFHLRRVSLKKCDIPFRYAYSSVGEVIPENAGILEPGDYGWFWNSDANDDLRYSNPTFPFSIGNLRQIPFSELIKFTSLTEEQRKPYEMQESLKEAVEMRDVKCFFTNRSRENANLKPAWIIPPLWVFQVTNGDEPEPFHTAENVLLVEKYIEPHWDNNQFAVDVEDDYRIVRFQKLPPQIDALLPQHLLATPDPTMDKFLRKHFIWCLEVNIMGGDNCENWSDESIWNFIQKVGLLPADESGDDNDDYDEDEDSDDDDVKKVKGPPQPNHEIWQSELGKEVFAMWKNDLLFKDDF